MSTIQGGLIQKKLRKALGILGSSPAPTVAPEVVPVVIAENLAGSIPDAPIFDLPVFAFRDQAATAGNYSYVQVWNPTGSKRVIEVSQAQIYTPQGATEVSLRRTTARQSYTSLIYFAARDFSPGQAANVEQELMAQVDVSAAVGDGLGSFNLTTLPEVFEVGITLWPGTGLLFVNKTVNNILEVGVWGDCARLPE